MTTFAKTTWVIVIKALASPNETASTLRNAFSYTTSYVRSIKTTSLCLQSTILCKTYAKKVVWPLQFSEVKKIAQSWNLTTIKQQEVFNSLKCLSTDLKSGRPEDYFMTYSDRHHLFLCETVDIAHIDIVYFNPLFSETALLIGDCFIFL